MVQTINTFSLFDAKFYFAIGVGVRDYVDLFSVYGSKIFHVLIQSTSPYVTNLLMFCDSLLTQFPSTSPRIEKTNDSNYI